MPPNPMEVEALQEISDLVKHPLYQEECPQESPAATSKAYASNALTKALCASNHEDSLRRLILWEAAALDLFSAGIHANLEVYRQWGQNLKINEAARGWLQLTKLLYQTQTTAANVYTYWRGWNEALAHPKGNPEGSLPELTASD